MKTLFQNIKRLYKRIKYRFGAPLPVGTSEFEAWATDLIDTYGWPDNPSTRFALTIQVLHADASKKLLPNHYFFLQMNKGAANQIAHGIMQDIKNKQIALAEEEQRKQQESAKPVEATTLSVVASDGQTG